MAGLAEAAFFRVLLIIGGVLLLVAGLLAIAWRKGSPTAAMIALVLAFLIGLFLQPWNAFAPPTSADPDEAFWLVCFRIASVVWTLLFVTGVAFLITLIRRRRIHDTNAA
jgi:hypothetical protein